MTRVVYSEACLADFGEILDYLGEQAPESAVQVVEELMDLCELLTTQPRMGALCEQVSPGLRLFPYGRYVVYYRYQEADRVIRIRRVLHHSRDVARQSFE